MTIYDKKISVYDNLDCIAEAEVEDIDYNDLQEAKNELSCIDNDLNSVIEDLEIVDTDHTDGDLRLEEVNEFFENKLPEVIEKLNKLRERLY